jgi:hypothetical protein
MDKDGIAAGAQHLRMPGTLSSGPEIEEYTGYLMDFLQQLVEIAVPLTKPSPDYACGWWSPEVRAAVHHARAARQSNCSEEHLQAAMQTKKKVICRAKTAKFRDDIHKAAASGDSI